MKYVNNDDVVWAADAVRFDGECNFARSWWEYKALVVSDTYYEPIDDPNKLWELLDILKPGDINHSYFNVKDEFNYFIFVRARLKGVRIKNGKKENQETEGDGYYPLPIIKKYTLDPDRDDPKMGEIEAEVYDFTGYEKLLLRTGIRATYTPAQTVKEYLVKIAEAEMMNKGMEAISDAYQGKEKI